MAVLGSKKKLVLLVSFILIFGFLATNLISYHMARASMRNYIMTRSLPLTSDNIYSEIQRDLIRPVFISSLMARNTFLIDWVLNGEKDVAQIAKYLKEIKQKYGAFTCFFVSEATKNYYYFDGILKKVKPNVEADHWYFRVRDMKDRYETNVDPDMANNNAMTIFINYKVFDSAGKLLGVTGVGLQVKSLSALMKYYSQKYQRNVYFMNSKGDLMLASDSIMKHYKNISEIAGLSKYSDLLLSGKDNKVTYQRDGVLHFVNGRFIKELNWFLLVEQNERSSTARIQHALLVNLAICGAITFVVIIITILAINVYERANKQQQQQIIEQNLLLVEKTKKLEEANNERKQLLHILCHDLSNPFNSLISCLTLIEHNPSSQKNLLPQINEALKNGVGVIDLVKKMRALDEGKSQLELIIFPLKPLVEESRLMLGSIFEKKNISLKIQIEEDVSVLIDCVSFINSVLNNLLTNAVKFSERGSEVIVEAKTLSVNMTELNVIDKGIGIPPKILENLFDLKLSTTREGTEGEAGTGFGMPLVKKFVEAYGGTIEVESKDIQRHSDDHGTTVCLRLRRS